MEQIETQVSDLRYLTQTPGERRPSAAGAPIAATPYDPLSHTMAAGSPASAASGGDNSGLYRGHSTHHTTTHAAASRNSMSADGATSASNGAKRKADEEEGAAGPTKQQRSKRNRYISIACNECKRRKIKCNGESPCQRCGNLNLTCLYAPNCCSNNFKESDEFRTMTDKVAKLQEQVDSLFQNLSALRTETLPRMLPPQDRMLPLLSPSGPPTVSPSPVLSHGSAYRPELTQPKPAYRGGTVGAPFATDAPTIPPLGFKSLIHVAGSEPDEQSPRGGPQGPPTPTDPLWDMSSDEMIRLCRLHEDEVGILFPVVNMQTVISHAQSLAAFMESSRRNGMLPNLNDEMTLLLKIIICCALTFEDQGHNDKANRMYESMQSELNAKLMAEATNVRNLPMLILLACYRFLSSEEILAWRVMGQVSRLCLELGLHNRSSMMLIEIDEDRKTALTCFWFSYIYERLWSFGSGLPYVVRDEDIDLRLPPPEDHPYLMTLIAYSRLGARVFQLTSKYNHPAAREMPAYEVDHLDREIVQWYDNAPEEVKMKDWSQDKQLGATSSYNLKRLRIWTYLRYNQLRMWLYMPFVQNAHTILNNPRHAQTVVHLASDTIRLLNHLDTSSNLYRKLQVFYHQFLTSSVAVLFLAAAHCPQRFAAVCRDHFYMVLDLVKDLSAKSWVSKRLWRTFNALKEVAPKIAGTLPNMGEGTDSSSGASSAARVPQLPQVGPYSRPTIRSAPVPARPGGPYNHDPPMAQSANGMQLMTEMRRVFDVYIGAGNQGPAKVDLLPTPNSLGRFVEENVSHHFRDLF